MLPHAAARAGERPGAAVGAQVQAALPHEQGPGGQGVLRGGCRAAPEGRGLARVEPGCRQD
eukprot:3879835-Pyramimonas_sp.AAC.1